ncbi:hypothetical protein PN499_22195 [Kamptonema animale CS-326]|uniref:hypothetical protein n=1 Tax=Kamptonema animale TaxID=92934 RepID=UPI00232BA55A|nr:hypothetical protein [Kamptonema animale]MDB9513915.1 hypothetical protein [Kamptonema animale CS-326]
MPIRILPKFNSGNPEPEHNPAPTESIFARLNAKLKYEQENIKPFLGDLYPLYRDECVIFHAGIYIGNGYNYSSSKNDDYDRIGQLLAKM